VKDYGDRLHRSMQGLQKYMAHVSPLLLGLQQHVKYAPTQTYHEYGKIKNEIVEAPASVVIFNAGPRQQKFLASFLVSSADVCVEDASGKQLQSQVNPHWDGRHVSTRAHMLYIAVDLVAYGFTTLSLAFGTACTAVASITATGTMDDNVSSLLQQSVFGAVKTSVENEIVIDNGDLRCTFAAASGGLLALKSSKAAGKSTEIKEVAAIYRSTESGAYLFKPIGDAVPMDESSMSVYLIQGPILTELRASAASMGSPIVTRVTRLPSVSPGRPSALEMIYVVDMSEKKFANEELVVRFKTDIENGNTFYSDLNGLYYHRRHQRDQLPLQGNFFPMPSVGMIEDSMTRLSVHSNRALGVAALKPGWLEVMMERRVTANDAKGLEGGVQDNILTEISLTLLLEQAPALHKGQPVVLPTRQSLLLGLSKNYPPFILSSQSKVEPQDWSSEHTPLPSHVWVLSWRMLNVAKSKSAMVLHSHGTTESWDATSGKYLLDKVDLQAWLGKSRVAEASEWSLSFMHEMERTPYPLEIEPMQMSAVKLHRAAT
jgi:alpha-mannosidase II